MSSFLRFFDEAVSEYPMHMEIYYSKIMDYWIRIYKKGCADDGEDLGIINVQEDCDIELVFAKAHVELKEWLLENEGGY